MTGTPGVNIINSLMARREEIRDIDSLLLLTIRMILLDSLDIATNLSHLKLFVIYIHRLPTWDSLTVYVQYSGGPNHSPLLVQ